MSYKPLHEMTTNEKLEWFIINDKAASLLRHAEHIDLINSEQLRFGGVVETPVERAVREFGEDWEDLHLALDL